MYCAFIAGMLNSYPVIFASMSGMALAHGVLQTEDLETLVGALGLLVSLSALLWPAYQAQSEIPAAKTDQMQEPSVDEVTKMRHGQSSLQVTH